MRKEILFTGSGGQGVIMASIILAEAAALYEGRHVVQSQAYGPEARGGHSSASVIISAERIGYPKAVEPHAMVCLTQDALDHFGYKLRPGGLLLIDSLQVRKLGRLDARVYRLPMWEAVRDQVGKPITFNICVLGALVGLSGLVRPESLRRVVETRVPPAFLAANLQAMDLGLELARGALPTGPREVGALVVG